jgi:hypothetical protein
MSDVFTAATVANSPVIRMSDDLLVSETNKAPVIDEDAWARALRCRRGRPPRC